MSELVYMVARCMRYLTHYEKSCHFSPGKGIPEHFRKPAFFLCKIHINVSSRRVCTVHPKVLERVYCSRNDFFVIVEAWSHVSLPAMGKSEEWVIIRESEIFTLSRSWMILVRKPSQSDLAAGRLENNSSES